MTPEQTVKLHPKGETTSSDNPSLEVDLDTLQHILMYSKQSFQKGWDAVGMHIERNSTTEQHKALAIQVFSTAVYVWKLNIIKAAQMAADVCGASAKSVRKWAAEYYVFVANMSRDYIDEEVIENVLRKISHKSSKYDVQYGI